MLLVAATALAQAAAATSSAAPEASGPGAPAPPPTQVLAPLPSAAAQALLGPGEAACDFDALAGLEFAFPQLDATLRGVGYVLWRLEPSLLADPLPPSYAGRRGKLEGGWFWAQGERWLVGVLDDCGAVYAMDTSEASAEGPLLNLASVGRIYYLRHLRFARGLVGSQLRVAPQLEPNHRLYAPAGGSVDRLAPGELLEVLGVHTPRYGHTKGLGGFYLEVRNARGQQGLVKFHHDYLQGPQGEPLWSLALRPASVLPGPAPLPAAAPLPARAAQLAE